MAEVADRREHSTGKPGDDDAADGADDPVARQKNRRVEIVIGKKG
jgi:flagellar motor protein MotB